MRYVTTNIRLPEDLWKSLKEEAAERGKRFTEIVRERLTAPFKRKVHARGRPKSLYGIWKDLDIPDSAVAEAKRSLFPSPDKFLKE